MLSSVDVPWRPGAALYLRAGFLCLREVADQFLLPYDPDPAPDDPISVTRDEFDQSWDEMAAAGVPMKADRDQAWADFRGWRVNYDQPLLGLCALVEPPPAPWSSDRVAPVQRRVLATVVAPPAGRPLRPADLIPPDRGVRAGGPPAPSSCGERRPDRRCRDRRARRHGRPDRRPARRRRGPRRSRRRDNWGVNAAIGAAAIAARTATDVAEAVDRLDPRPGRRGRGPLADPAAGQAGRRGAHPHRGGGRARPRSRRSARPPPAWCRRSTSTRSSRRSTSTPCSTASTSTDWSTASTSARSSPRST